jgi:hypothetical protein
VLARKPVVGPPRTLPSSRAASEGRPSDDEVRAAVASEKQGGLLSGLLG